MLLLACGDDGGLRADTDAATTVPGSTSSTAGPPGTTDTGTTNPPGPTTGAPTTGLGSDSATGTPPGDTSTEGTCEYEGETCTDDEGYPAELVCSG